jgi:type IV pilus assembly protein PilA
MKMNATRKGFTLVEIMIVVAIIGLLSGLAVPYFLISWQRANVTRFSREIVSHACSFQVYCLEYDGWPADGAAGIIPAGMENFLDEDYEEETCIGGYWDWDAGVFGFTAGISVFSPDYDDDLMQDVDTILDDGDLSTGIFRSRGDGTGYIYILEE